MRVGEAIIHKISWAHFSLPPSISAQQRAIVVTGLYFLPLLLVALVHHLWLGQSSLTALATWLISWAPAGDDSWEPMRKAYIFWKDNPSVRLYEHTFFETKTKFQYPPSSLILNYISDTVGYRLSNPMLNFASRLAVAAQVCSMGALAAVLASRWGSPTPTRFMIGSFAALAMFGTMAFYPVVQGYFLGQIQTWLNAAFILACLAYSLDRRILAGLFVGAICLVKPHFSLFLLWAAVRRQWQFIAGWCLIAIPISLASLLIFGFANHSDYLNVLSHLSRHGEVFSPNQSLNGLLNRLLATGDSLTFKNDAFPPYNFIVHFGTLASSLALIGTALLYRRRATNVSLADFLIMGVTLTIASPIAWEHHYGILPAAYVLLWVFWIFNPHARRTLQWILLASSHAFASVWWLSFDLLAGTWLNILQSYLYLAALVLLWLLYAERDEIAAVEMSSAEVRPLLPT